MFPWADDVTVWGSASGKPCDKNFRDRRSIKFALPFVTLLTRVFEIFVVCISVLGFLPAANFQLDKSLAFALKFKLRLCVGEKLLLHT